MDNILKHLGGIIKKQTSAVVQEPLTGLIMLNFLHLRRSEQG